MGNAVTRATAAGSEEPRLPGSARVPRAGNGVLAIANFLSCLIVSTISVLSKDCFGETPKPARATRALPGTEEFWDPGMNFRVEHHASSIKNVISSIESQHSVT